jgi:hypothetical protein
MVFSPSTPKNEITLSLKCCIAHKYIEHGYKAGVQRLLSVNAQVSERSVQVANKAVETLNARTEAPVASLCHR